MNERVDQVLESCIEVESNRRLLDENLNYLTLTFKDSKMERNVSRENCSCCYKSYYRHRLQRSSALRTA